MPEPFTPVIAVDIDGFQVEVDASNDVRYTEDNRWTFPLSSNDGAVIVRLVKELVRLQGQLEDIEMEAKERDTMT